MVHNIVIKYYFILSINMYRQRGPGRPKNTRELVRMSVHIPKQHYGVLVSLAEEEDLSVAQIVRRALELYLVSQKDVLGIDDSDISYSAHLTETRSKRAIIVSHAEKFYALNNVSLDDGSSIFEDLNPAAFQ